jgi:hypothetical protein
MISATFEVTDPDLLTSYVIERYRKAWSDQEWTPTSLGESVMEAVISSNENPSFDQYGLEICDSFYREFPE